MPTMTVDGYPIAYAEAGSGAPVVMVHGTLGDQRSFAGQVEAFGAQYHAISISLRHCWPISGAKMGISPLRGIWRMWRASFVGLARAACI